MSADLETGTALEGENAPMLKPHPGKKTGVTSASSFLAARKPPASFVKLAGPDAECNPPRAGSVIDEDATAARERDAETNQLLPAGKRAHHIVLENTFKMAPDPDKRFSTAAVNKVVQSVLTERLAEVRYDPKVCRDLSIQISDDIRQQVKQLGFERYKIVCVTHIGQKGRQAIRIGSLCCWDRETDNFAEYSFVNGSLFAVAMVFGIYQE